MTSGVRWKKRTLGFQPIAVTGQGAIVEAAISAAVDKLVRTIDRTLEKKYGAKGAPRRRNLQRTAL